MLQLVSWAGTWTQTQAQATGRTRKEPDAVTGNMLGRHDHSQTNTKGQTGTKLASGACHSRGSTRGDKVVVIGVLASNWQKNGRKWTEIATKVGGITGDDSVNDVGEASLKMLVID